MYFVPELRGAITFDLNYEGRIGGVLSDTRHDLAAEVLGIHAGYLHYLDGHGALAVGGYLGGSGSVGDGPVHTRAEAGTAFRLRAISADFYHLTLGAFAEAGLLSTRESLGSRFAGGLEMGPGLLWFLDPYVFGEYVARLGVETVRMDGTQVPVVFASMRIVFDFCIRGSRP